MIDDIQPTQLASGIASAPGDLPMSAIRERQALLATQFRHDNTISPAAPTPDQAVGVTATSGAGLGIRRAEIWYTTDGSWPDADSPRLPMTQTEVEWTPATSYLLHWQADLPPQPDGAIVRYKIAGYEENASTPGFFAHDGSGFWFKLGEAGVTTFAYRVRPHPRGLPGWMNDAVIYHIFVDRFRNDAADGAWPADLDPQGKHGGTLRGVINALPYLTELGVNCLWLSPIGPSPTYHRYDQSHYFSVDPDLGGLEAVRELVAAAHARGVRLILDFVPSHGSWKMPEFVAAQQDREAPSASWFVFDEWPDKYRCFLDVVPTLVSFNTNDDGLRRFLIDSATFWVADIGFDGLRLDHTIGHGLDFWVEFSTALERIKPDVALFGEATDTPDMLRRYRGRLQAILDFPLAQTLRMTFARGDWGVAELDGMLRAYFQFMAEGPDRISFLDNHDMNRFLFLADGDARRLKLAALCLFTLPFPPILYYGTEIGLSQMRDKDAAGFGGDHEVRRDMPWDDSIWDHDLLSFFKALIRFRHQRPVLRRGDWHPLHANTERQVYSYKLASDSAEIHVFFNLSEDSQEIQLEPAQPRQVLFSTNPENNLDDVEAIVSLAGLSGVVIGKLIDRISTD